MQLHGIDNRLQRGAVVALYSDKEYVVISRCHRYSMFCIPLTEPEISQTDSSWRYCEERIEFLHYIRTLTEEEILTHWSPIVRRALTKGTRLKHKWTYNYRRDEVNQILTNLRIWARI